MEEKKYPISEEEEKTGMACETSSAVASAASCTSEADIHDWIDDLDWDRFPSNGPFSEEEAIARIEEAEKDLNDPTKWITSEEFDRQLYEKAIINMAQ